MKLFYWAEVEVGKKGPAEFGLESGAESVVVAETAAVAVSKSCHQTPFGIIYQRRSRHVGDT